LQEALAKAGIRCSNRSFSIRSEEALNALLGIEVRLKQIEDRVAELDMFVRRLGPHSSGLSKAKTELAQLEADAHKLESTGVDNIYTSELESGKASAKETKKDQLRRLEALFNRIDDIFHTIAKGATCTGAAASPAPVAEIEALETTPPHTPKFPPS
jgi:chromosome segregation ATPase